MDRLKLLETGLRAFDTCLPEVAPWRCIRTRYQAGSCRLCQDACPHEAVETVPWLTIDADRCSSCGACAAVCRTGALAYAERGRGWREWLTTAAGDDGTPVLACARASHAVDEALTIRCAGGLSVADLLAASTAGAEEIVVVTGECAGCPDATAGRRLGEELGAACEAVTLLGEGHSLSVLVVGTATSAPDEPSPGGERPQAISRRDLFAFVGRRARRATADALTPAKLTIEELHRQTPPPQRHAWLVKDLLATTWSAALSDARLPAVLPLAEVIIGSACDGCGLCERYCPHAALTSATGGLHTNPAACTACGLCVEVCPREALELRPLTFRALRDAARGAPAATPA